MTENLEKRLKIASVLTRAALTSLYQVKGKTENLIIVATATVNAFSVLLSIISES
jgi:hypothetical protein